MIKFKKIGKAKLLGNKKNMSIRFKNKETQRITTINVQLTKTAQKFPHTHLKKNQENKRTQPFTRMISRLRSENKKCRHDSIFQKEFLGDSKKLAVSQRFLEFS